MYASRDTIFIKPTQVFSKMYSRACRRSIIIPREFDCKNNSTDLLAEIICIIIFSSPSSSWFCFVYVLLQPSKSAQLDFLLFAWLQGILRFLFFYHQSQTFRRMRLSLICLDEEKSLILLLHPNPLQVTSEEKVIYVLGEVERLFLYC